MGVLLTGQRQDKEVKGGRTGGSPPPGTGPSHSLRIHTGQKSSKTAQGTQGLLATSTFTTNPALLAIQEVPAKAPGTAKARNITVMSDEGSQITLVRKGCAVALRLGPGTPWTLYLQVVGSQFREIQTTLHTLALVDSEGKERTVIAAAVNSIASCGKSWDLKPVQHLFSGAKKMSSQGHMEKLICCWEHATEASFPVESLI